MRLPWSRTPWGARTLRAPSVRPALMGRIIIGANLRKPSGDLPGVGILPSPTVDFDGSTLIAELACSSVCRVAND